MIYLTATLVLIILLSIILSERPAGPLSYLPIDPKKTPNKPAGFKGTPIDKKNRFVFEEAPFYQNFLRVFAFLPAHFGVLWFSRKKKIEVIQISDTSFLHGEDCMIWLGHASYFMRLNGKNLLIDPHFHNIYSYKRHTKNPIDPEQFKFIDYILLSHDHADHFDTHSIKTVLNNNPSATILTGMHMRNLLQEELKINPDIQENLWFEKFETDGLSITFLPNRHYSKRIFRPFNATLWGGFMISYNNGTIYWSGDSGYSGHFREIGETFKPDLFIVGTGAYKPRWFMKDNHMDPDDAYKAFKDSGAKMMVPMHFGTFQLGNETTDDVLNRLNKLGKDVRMLTIGRIYTIPDVLFSTGEDQD